MSEQNGDDDGWDEYGERVVATGVCIYCGEDLDEWEIRLEQDTRIARPVLLWKHHVDGAVICSLTHAATPAPQSA